MTRTHLVSAIALVGSLLLGSAGASAQAAAKSAAVVLEWNDSALALVRAAKASDAQAARVYAMVNVAIYDSVNGILSHRGMKRGFALVGSDGAPPAGDLVAAAATAAHDVLASAFPTQAASLDAQLAKDLSARGQSGAVSTGR